MLWFPLSWLVFRVSGPRHRFMRRVQNRQTVRDLGFQIKHCLIAVLGTKWQWIKQERHFSLPGETLRVHCPGPARWAWLIVLSSVTCGPSCVLQLHQKGRKQEGKASCLSWRMAQHFHLPVQFSSYLLELSYLGTSSCKRGWERHSIFISKCVSDFKI